MKIKSRKIFAILLITAMVLAMLPVTVFADIGGADFSATRSTLSVNKTSLAVGEDATFTISLRKADGAEKGDCPSCKIYQ